MRKLWNNGLTRGSNYYIRKRIVENSQRRQQAAELAAQKEADGGYWYPSRPRLPHDHPVYQAWARGELPNDQ